MLPTSCRVVFIHLDTHRIPLILGLCFFYASLPPISSPFSSLPSLSCSQGRPASFFSLWLKAHPGEKTTGDIPGALFHQLVLHQCLIRTLRPLTNHPLFLLSFLSVYFSPFLTCTVILPFSSDNE